MAKRNWTEEQRRKMSEKIRASKPWLKSTGPKTDEGKRIAVGNACKHGFYSEDGVELRRALREQAHFIRMVDKSLKLFRKT